MTPNDLLDDLRSRINPAYVMVLGTESYERKMCADAIESLLAERDAISADYQQCCGLVAQMHRAAMGGTIGPVRGVVEDIQDLRSERDAPKEDVAESDAVREKCAQLLAETAVAIKGPEKALHRHGWQDLPQAATSLIAERDALALQVAQMREALELWKIASDNSEEVEFDDMAAYSIPMPLYCDADEATEEALALPDLSTEVIKQHDAGVLREVIERVQDKASIGQSVNILSIIDRMIEELEQTKCSD